MRLINFIRSLRAAFKASGALGRASRKRQQGKLAEALYVALEGLVILRRPYVQRHNIHEGGVLAGLTALAEEVAWKLNVPGVPIQDLKDTVAYLEALNTGSSPPELCSYIPFLESRLAEHKD